MAIIVSEKNVKKNQISDKSFKKIIFDQLNLPTTDIIFEKYVMSRDDLINLKAEADQCVWLMLLEGSAESSIDSIKGGSTLFLPPQKVLDLQPNDHCIFLKLTVNNFKKHSKDKGTNLETVHYDYLKEPVLNSEHDKRTRVYLASKELIKNSAFVSEIVTFPSQVKSSNHCHYDVEHFQFLLQGEGIVFLDNTPVKITKGDFVYKLDGEYHHVHNTGEDPLIFVEFFIPGIWETIWSDESKRCAWNPTGQNSLGTEPTRDIKSHISDGKIVEGV